MADVLRVEPYPMPTANYLPANTAQWTVDSGHRDCGCPSSGLRSRTVMAVVYNVDKSTKGLQAALGVSSVAA